MIRNSASKDTGQALNAFFPKAALNKTNRKTVKFYSAIGQISAQDRIDFVIVEPVDGNWGTQYQTLFGQYRKFGYIVQYDSGYVFPTLGPTTTIVATTTSAPTTTTVAPTTVAPTTTVAGTTVAPTTTISDTGSF